MKANFISRSFLIYNQAIDKIYHRNIRKYYYKNIAN